MAALSITVQVVVPNEGIVLRLSTAVREFIELYEDNGYETDEGRELKAAMSSFAANIRICDCRDCTK